MVVQGTLHQLHHRKAIMVAAMQDSLQIRMPLVAVVGLLPQD
jgi:hypothetical protein